jgi:hypothetical protein
MTRELWWVDAFGVEYQFNELDLGVIVLDGPIGLDAPPVELSTAPRPGDGSILREKRYAARPVTIPLLFNGSTHREAMAALVHSFSYGPGSLKHVETGAEPFSMYDYLVDAEGNPIVDEDGAPVAGDPASVARVVRTLRNVVYDGGLEGDDAQARSDWSRKVLNLVALDPYWYGETEDIALGPPEADTAYNDAVDYDAEIAYDGAAAGISAGVGYDDAIDYDADIPYDGGSVVTFGLDSDLGVWPTITVRGPATFVQVVHLGTGETIETLPGVEVPGGRDMLIVNRPEDRTIMLAGAEAWDRVTAGSSASMLVRPGQITDLRDENGTQVRDPNGRIILVQGQADRLSVLVRGTSASSWVRIAWEERWLTP